MSGFDVFRSRLVITGDLVSVSPIRIGSGRSTSSTEVDLPVIKDNLGRPYIPGSSIKGAMRSYAESVLRGIELQGILKTAKPLSCDVISDPCVSDDMAKRILSADVLEPDAALMSELCLVCRLFGSMQAAAKLSLSDMPIQSDTWAGQTLLRHGVAIDRDTNTAADQMLYELEVVPASAMYSFTALLDNASDAEESLFLLLIDALEKERIMIGGSRSRGTGTCRLVNITCTRHTSALDYLLGRAGQALNAEDRWNVAQRFPDVAGGEHA